jgi:hypothetical protein
MPASTLNSVSWPLKVIFVVTFVVGIIGLFCRGIVPWAEPTSWILIGISIAMALLLLAPTLADFMRNGAINAALNKVAERLNSLVASTGGLAKKVEENSTKAGGTETNLGGRLKTIEDQLNNLVRPSDGRLVTIESKLDGRLAKIEERLGQLSNVVGKNPLASRR